MAARPVKTQSYGNTSKTQSKPLRSHEMSKRMFALCLMILSMSGCSTTGLEIDCNWVKPIYISKDDAMTVETARQVLEHNETGAKLCGWSSK